MYIDRDAIQEFPYFATFTRTVEKEGASYLEPQEETITVLETECDVQESSHATAGTFVSSDFTVFFPFNKEDGVVIQSGDTAEVDVYGVIVKGKVLGVFPSQMGAVKVYLKDLDV